MLLIQIISPSDKFNILDALKPQIGDIADIASDEREMEWDNSYDFEVPTFQTENLECDLDEFDPEEKIFAEYLGFVPYISIGLEYDNKTNVKITMSNIIDHKKSKYTEICSVITIAYALRIISAARVAGNITDEQYKNAYYYILNLYRLRDEQRKNTIESIKRQVEHMEKDNVDSAVLCTQLQLLYGKLAPQHLTKGLYDLLLPDITLLHNLTFTSRLGKWDERLNAKTTWYALIYIDALLQKDTTGADLRNEIISKISRGVKNRENSPAVEQLNVAINNYKKAVAPRFREVYDIFELLLETPEYPEFTRYRNLEVDMVCPVCLLLLDPAQSAILTCGHVIHRDCIDTWFKTKTPTNWSTMDCNKRKKVIFEKFDCPICRQNVPYYYTPAWAEVYEFYKNGTITLAEYKHWLYTIINLDRHLTGREVEKYITCLPDNLLLDIYKEDGIKARDRHDYHFFSDDYTHKLEDKKYKFVKELIERNIPNTPDYTLRYLYGDTAPNYRKKPEYFLYNFDMHHELQFKTEYFQYDKKDTVHYAIFHIDRKLQSLTSDQDSIHEIFKEVGHYSKPERSVEYINDCLHTPYPRFAILYKIFKELVRHNPYYDRMCARTDSNFHDIARSCCETSYVKVRDTYDSTLKFPFEKDFVFAAIVCAGSVNDIYNAFKIKETKEITDLFQRISTSDCGIVIRNIKEPHAYRKLNDEEFLRKNPLVADGAEQFLINLDQLYARINEADKPDRIEYISRDYIYHTKNATGLFEALNITNFTEGDIAKVNKFYADDNFDELNKLMFSLKVTSDEVEALVAIIMLGGIDLVMRHYNTDNRRRVYEYISKYNMLKSNIYLLYDFVMNIAPNNIYVADSIFYNRKDVIQGAEIVVRHDFDAMCKIINYMFEYSKLYKRKVTTIKICDIIDITCEYSDFFIHAYTIANADIRYRLLLDLYHVSKKLSGDVCPIKIRVDEGYYTFLVDVCVKNPNSSNASAPNSKIGSKNPNFGFAEDVPNVSSYLESLGVLRTRSFIIRELLYYMHIKTASGYTATDVMYTELGEYSTLTTTAARFKFTEALYEKYVKAAYSTQVNDAIFNPTFSNVKLLYRDTNVAFIGNSLQYSIDAVKHKFKWFKQQFVQLYSEERRPFEQSGEERRLAEQSGEERRPFEHNIETRYKFFNATDKSRQECVDDLYDSFLPNEDNSRTFHLAFFIFNDFHSANDIENIKNSDDNSAVTLTEQFLISNNIHPSYYNTLKNGLSKYKNFVYNGRLQYQEQEIYPIPKRLYMKCIREYSATLKLVRRGVTLDDDIFKCYNQHFEVCNRNFYAGVSDYEYVIADYYQDVYNIRFDQLVHMYNKNDLEKLLKISGLEKTEYTRMWFSVENYTKDELWQYWIWLGCAGKVKSFKERKLHEFLYTIDYLKYTGIDNEVLNQLCKLWLFDTPLDSYDNLYKMLEVEKSDKRKVNICKYKFYELYHYARYDKEIFYEYYNIPWSGTDKRMTVDVKDLYNAINNMDRNDKQNRVEFLVRLITMSVPVYNISPNKLVVLDEPDIDDIPEIAKERYDSTIWSYKDREIITIPELEDVIMKCENIIVPTLQQHDAIRIHPLLISSGPIDNTPAAIVNSEFIAETPADTIIETPIVEARNPTFVPDSDDDEGDFVRPEGGRYALPESEAIVPESRSSELSLTAGNENILEYIETGVEMSEVTRPAIPVIIPTRTPPPAAITQTPATTPTPVIVPQPAATTQTPATTPPAVTVQTPVIVPAPVITQTLATTQTPVIVPSTMTPSGVTAPTPVLGQTPPGETHPIAQVPVTKEPTRSPPDWNPIMPTNFNFGGTMSIRSKETSGVPFQATTAPIFTQPMTTSSGVPFQATSAPIFTQPMTTSLKLPSTMTLSGVPSTMTPSIMITKEQKPKIYIDSINIDRGANIIFSDSWVPRCIQVDNTVIIKMVTKLVRIYVDEYRKRLISYNGRIP